jgi:6-phosphogluconate dehydrogenase
MSSVKEKTVTNPVKALQDHGQSVWLDFLARGFIAKGGLMQAYAEGFDILKNANIDALPAEHRFDLDIADIAEVWRRGSVIPSWLLDLTASALAENQTLDNYSGFVEDSGEGRWTVNAAIDEAVPAEVLTAALYARFRSRKDHTFAEKILSAMRAGFGGHKEPPKKPETKA